MLSESIISTITKIHITRFDSFITSGNLMTKILERDVVLDFINERSKNVYSQIKVGVKYKDP